MIGRRKFLERAALGTLSLGPGACFAESRDAPTDDAWSLEVLGDIHYDHLEHHDMNWVKREKPKSVPQIENYSRITKENYPFLLQSLKNEVRDDDTCRGVIQVGDLVQGLCGSESLAQLQCKEAVASLTALELGKPVWITKGNHDITGPGALEAYEEMVLPFCGDLGDESNPSQYVREENRWLIITYDGYSQGSLDWLEQVLEGRAPGRVLFVVHQPVVPYNARSSWGVYGKASQSERRERLLKLLGKHRAIVLSGHLHKHSFVERETEHGSFTQLSVSSVAYALDGEPKNLISGLENYTPDLIDLEPNHSPETIVERRAMLESERPHIRRFDYGDFWGRAKLRITGDKVEADIFQMLGKTPWKTIDLTPAQG